MAPFGQGQRVVTVLVGHRPLPGGQVVDGGVDQCFADGVPDIAAQGIVLCFYFLSFPLEKHDVLAILSVVDARAFEECLECFRQRQVF